MPLFIMFVFFMVMRTITSRLFPTRGGAQLPPRYAPVSQTRAPAPTRPTLPPPARPSPTPAPPAKTAERELEERRVEFENKGKEMARQAGVEFVRVENWQSKSMFPIYWFRDAKGNNIRALDLEELKGKLAILAKHHSVGDKITYQGEEWVEEYSTAEYTVYLSADGKKRLYENWDGSWDVYPNPQSPEHPSSPENELGKVMHVGRTTTQSGAKFWHIGACIISEGLCIEHGYPASENVRCPKSEMTDEEWHAAYQLVKEAFPTGQEHGSWVDGWWPGTWEEAQGAIAHYEHSMWNAYRKFEAQSYRMVAQYANSRDKAIYYYRKYVEREYERGRQMAGVR